MKTDREQVREYYNSTAKQEWERIDHRPEFLLTCRFLDRMIAPGDRVLDIGGGPGRYSIHLAGRGCRVTLLDLAEENVRLAEEHAKEAGVEIRAVAADALSAGSALRERGILPDGGFDAVLLMGPLYHLLEEEEREDAVREALSLLKPGGLLCASFILTTADLQFRMKYPDNAPILTENPSELDFRAALLRGESWSGDGFTRAHFSDVCDIEPFMARFPLDPVVCFGQEGIMGPCEETIMKRTPEEIEEWLRFSETISMRREYWGFAEHLMFIGRKRG